MAPASFTLIQRGAGNGKTIESVQWLELDAFTQFVYITKQHSAKDVVYAELKESNRGSSLCGLQGRNAAEPHVGARLTGRLESHDNAYQTMRAMVTISVCPG